MDAHDNNAPLNPDESPKSRENTGIIRGRPLPGRQQGDICLCPNPGPAATYETGVCDDCGKPIVHAVDAEVRWQNATALGALHGVKCTGSPWETVCDAPGALGVILHGQLFALPCRKHADDIITYIMQRGHGSCRLAPLVDLLDTHTPERVKAANVAIRTRNHRDGIHLPPGANFKGEKGKR